MRIQKKSVLSNLKTTKKAIVASNSTEDKPNVAAPVSARLKGRVFGRLQGRLVGRVAAKH